MIPRNNSRWFCVNPTKNARGAPWIAGYRVRCSKRPTAVPGSRWRSTSSPIAFSGGIFVLHRSSPSVTHPLSHSLGRGRRQEGLSDCWRRHVLNPNSPGPPQSVKINVPLGQQPRLWGSLQGSAGIHGGWALSAVRFQIANQCPGAQQISRRPPRP